LERKKIEQEEGDLTGSRRLGRQQHDGLVCCRREEQQVGSSSGRWSPAAAPQARDNQLFLRASP
jgi:hypothetical protein